VSIRDRIRPGTSIKHLPATQDDPQRRRPDISRASELLGWAPRFSLDQGIAETIEYFRAALKAEGAEVVGDEGAAAPKPPRVSSDEP
jgi:UDP-glucuronate decarboxylase